MARYTLGTIILRMIAAIAAFIFTLFISLIGSSALLNWAMSRFPPDVGNPSTDPSGRGYPSEVAVLPVGSFIAVLLALIAGWLGWHLSDRKNWSFDSLAAAPIFIIFSILCTANYAEADVIITRDTQAVLNLPLAISGIVVVLVLQKSLVLSRSLLLTLGGSIVLAFCIYGFVAIPLWYSLSYLSWKQGAGELDSMESAAKAISAAGSILAVAGLQWKNGTITFFDKKSAGGTGSASASSD